MVFGSPHRHLSRQLSLRLHGHKLCGWEQKCLQLCTSISPFFNTTSKFSNAVQTGCEHSCRGTIQRKCSVKRAQQSCPTHLAKVRLRHSPFLVPDLRDQLLVTLAQGWLLVCAYQAATLQEELSEWGAGLGVESQDRREMGGTLLFRKN